MNIDLIKYRTAGQFRTVRGVDLHQYRTNGKSSDGFPTTLSGSSPLTLPDSIKGKVKRYRVEGNCVQGGTPTPQSPIPVGCVGDEFVWNQLVNNGSEEKVNTAGTAWSSARYSTTAPEEGNNHKYYACAVVKGKSGNTFSIALGNNVAINDFQMTSDYALVKGVFTKANTSAEFAMYDNEGSGESSYIKNAMLVDLTLLCSRLSLSVPTTTAEAEALLASLGKDMSVYQPYTAGTSIYKVGVHSDSAEFNQWLGLKDTAEYAGITFTNNGDGSYTLNGTSTAETWSFQLNTPQVSPIVGHMYYLRGNPSNASTNTYFLVDGNGRIGGGDYIGAVSGRITSEQASTPWIVTIAVRNGVTCDNVVFKPKLIDLTQMFGYGNEPTTATEADRLIKMAGYDMTKAYLYNTGTKTMQSSASLLLSSPLCKIGSVVDYADSKQGVMHYFGKVDLGSLNWVYDNNIQRFSAPFTGVKARNFVPNFMSNYGYFPSINPIAPIFTDLAVAYYEGSFYLYNERYTDVATFKTAMSGVYLIYELATPTTETISFPALKTAKGATILSVDTATAPSKVEADYLATAQADKWYGVSFDTSNSSPTCTRIGNAQFHRSLPIQSKMRGCLLDDDGNVVKYLNATDWTSETRDGSQGQVMVEIPAHYVKFEEEGTIRKVKMSAYPLYGFHLVPKRYVSAYQASLQRSTNKLASVVNMDADYRGGDNTASWDGTYRSLLGKPASIISLTEFRTYARNRKAGSTQWNCHTYGTQKALYWLFVVEYATLNSQLAIDSTLTEEGYRKGGLGLGVSNATWGDWGNYNNRCPFINNGASDTLGNGSGAVEVTILNGDETTFVTTNVNRYRGVEMPFGHLYMYTDGILVESGATSDTNLHKVFIASNPADFASSIGTSYEYVGNQARAYDFGKSHIFGNGGEIIPTSVGGSATTYLCDYNYQDIPASGKVTRSVLFGGTARSSTDAGFVCIDSSYVQLTASEDFGSRLTFIPTTD